MLSENVRDKSTVVYFYQFIYNVGPINLIIMTIYVKYYHINNKLFLSENPKLEIISMKLISLYWFYVKPLGDG